MKICRALITIVSLSSLSVTLYTAEFLTAAQRKAFLSAERRVRTVVDVLGVQSFSYDQERYDQEVMAHYNEARKIMGQPVAQSIQEVSLRWIRQQQAQMLTPSASPESTHCDIAGLDKKQVLRALFNAAKHQGPYALGRSGCHPHLNELTDEAVEEALSSHEPLDYLQGRVMKLNFCDGDQLDVRSYNDNNGKNAAQNALQDLMTQKKAPAKAEVSTEGKL